MGQQCSPITAHATPGQIYEHIPEPTFDQLLRAMCFWDCLAEQFGLEYAFVGSIVAKISSNEDGFQVHTLEILVKPRALEDNARILTQIKDQHPEHLGITPTNRHIIVTDENRRGIALQFFATGSENYPNDFIPPYDSSRRSAQHLRKEPTFGHMLLSQNSPYDKWLPFIRCRCLLYQRLLRFNQNPQNAEQRRQSWQDLNDIKGYLNWTAKDKDSPFPRQVAQILLPSAIALIHYAENNFYPFTLEAINELRRLGFDVRNIS